MSGLSPVAALAQETPSVRGPELLFLPGVTTDTQTNIILSVLVALLLLLARRAVIAVVNRHVEESALRYRWAKVTANVAFVSVFLILF